MLPHALQEAHAELSRCDLIVCCGSSLQVYPVAMFPDRVLANGGAVAVVNIGPTGADHRARVRIELRTGEALPALVGLLAG
jgi:NAD-dependent deacetylase